MWEWTTLILFSALGNQERTLKCWYVMPATRATTPSVSSRPWIQFPLTPGNAESVSVALKTLSIYNIYLFHTCNLIKYNFFSRDVVCAQNVASKGWCCQVPRSGLTTIVFVKLVSVSAALCVLCAANLQVQPWPCSAAVYATGLLDAHGQIKY